MADRSTGSIIALTAACIEIEVPAIVGASPRSRPRTPDSDGAIRQPKRSGGNLALVDRTDNALPPGSLAVDDPVAVADGS